MSKKRTIVCLSGAGLSQESGIPTFRDSNGLWEGNRVEDVASQDGWQRDKELVLNFYAQRLRSAADVKPNKAHLALARLQEKFNVINITQNVDPLLERAGCINVWHLHGQIDKKKCEWHKEITVLDGDTNFTCDYKTTTKEPVELGELCPKCNGQMRPDVVWFGEAVQMLRTNAILDGDVFDLSIQDLCREVKYNNGVFICVGTSAQVYPAASLLPFFSQVKNKYIVDKDPIRVGDYTLIAGSAGEEMDKLAEALLNETAEV